MMCFAFASQEQVGLNSLKGALPFIAMMEAFLMILRFSRYLILRLCLFKYQQYEHEIWEVEENLIWTNPQHIEDRMKEAGFVDITTKTVHAKVGNWGEGVSFITISEVRIPALSFNGRNRCLEWSR